MNEAATITIFRFDPAIDAESRFEGYEVPYAHWHGKKVIDTIRYIYETMAPDLAFREPCRQQVCGACVMLVNKRPVLACGAFSEKEMVLEPLPGRKVVKDLIVALDEEKAAAEEAGEGRCGGCGVCVENCPVAILRVQNGNVRVIEPDLCTGCLLCREVCPEHSLKGK